MIERFSNRDIAIRFIEYMDVGATNGWSMEDVVSAEEIRQLIGELKPIPPVKKRDVAKRYETLQGSEVGLITSVTEPFCGNCTRARISADGRFFTCLFSSRGLDLLSPIRMGSSDEEIASLIRSHWQQSEDRYSEIRSEKTKSSDRIEMSYIGG